jgi:hypothetical protein
MSSNPFRRGVLDATLCDKVCQWLVTCRWFSLGLIFVPLRIFCERMAFIFPCHYFFHRITFIVNKPNLWVVLCASFLTFTLFQKKPERGQQISYVQKQSEMGWGTRIISPEKIWKSRTTNTNFIQWMWIYFILVVYGYSSSRIYGGGARWSNKADLIIISLKLTCSHHDIAEKLQSWH